MGPDVPRQTRPVTLASILDNGHDIRTTRYFEVATTMVRREILRLRIETGHETVETTSLNRTNPVTITRVIILAQGEQRRLPDLKTPKQLLPLPACGDVAILHRTLVQVAHILHEDKACEWMRPTVVCGAEIVQWAVERLAALSRPLLVTLGDPGNSSLKGISRYLDHATSPNCPWYKGAWDTTVVLLGDVVYSWVCLRELLKQRRQTFADYGFAGSHDLTPSGGELWGVAWNEVADDMMRTRLSHALAKHPPFISYQPGQMRRWLWEFCRTTRPALGKAGEWGDYQAPPHSNLPDLVRSGRYVAIDDYTRDIDVPEHLLQIPWLSEMAAADDRANGVTW